MCHLIMLPFSLHPNQRQTASSLLHQDCIKPRAIQAHPVLVVACPHLTRLPLSLPLHENPFVMQADVGAPDSAMVSWWDKGKE